MTAAADRWAVHPAHPWLRGPAPRQPVEYVEQLGMWHVFGYPEAVAVLDDPAAFSSRVARHFIPPDQFDPAVFDGNLSQLDPPPHRKLRGIVRESFTARTVDTLAPVITRLAAELIEGIDDDGGRGGAGGAGGGCSFDLVEALAYPLPVYVIAELLGVPGGDRDLLRKWADQALAARGQPAAREPVGGGPRSLAEQAGAQAQLDAYLQDLVLERRRRPREDLLTRLIRAEADGERLNDRQLVNFAGLLLSAGHLTTTMLLGNTILCLDAHPAAGALVRSNRALIPSAIEESLRLLSPLAAVYRVSTRPVELGGRRLPEGSVLHVWLSAANRDARQFPDAGGFDPARDPNPHLGFGRGSHFCLGAPLARLAGRLALGLLLDRFAELRVDPADPPVFLSLPDYTGVWRLPVRARRR